MEIAFILLLIGGIVLTVGDIVMKKWVTSHSYVFYIVGLVIYLVGLNFLAQSFKYKNIAVASVIFVIFNVVTLSLVSWLYFKETLSPLQILGIAVGICSIVILELA
jgi:multidrug transporter EmrE-like cation transporter